MNVPESESLQGLVLAAAPVLSDPNFHQTLVFMVEHDQRGAMGLVMNRPIGKKLGAVVSSPDFPAALAEVPVLMGGPVQNTSLVLASFRRGRTEEQMKCELNPDPLAVAELVDKRGCWVRAFVGYAGWGGGQLEGEMRQRAWSICKPHTAILDERHAGNLWRVFVDEDQRWRRLGRFLPKDPELN